MPDDERPARPKRGYLLPGVIALAALVVLGLVINFTGQSHPRPHTLAGPDAATLISQALQSQQGLSRPPQVTCPTSEPIQAGRTFRCTWHRAGGSTTVIGVTETDSTGRFTFTVGSG